MRTGDIQDRMYGPNYDSKYSINMLAKHSEQQVCLCCIPEKKKWVICIS